MNELRKLVYDFLSLPHCTQVRILGDLDLLDEGEENIGMAFNRAKQRGLINKLRISVASSCDTRDGVDAEYDARIDG